MKSYRFLNSGKQPMTIIVELWADEIIVPPGSTLTLHCEGSGLHAPTVEPVEGGLVFFPECSDYSAEIDGTPVET